MSRAPQVHVHIDRLVLDGVPEHERASMLAALHAQLGAALRSADLGNSRTLTHVPRARIDNGNGLVLGTGLAAHLSRTLRR